VMKRKEEAGDMTTADRIRDMIQERPVRIEGQGGDLYDNTSQDIATLWLEIDIHLKAADLCELLCEDSEMMRHLTAAKRLWRRFLRNCPTDIDTSLTRTQSESLQNHFSMTGYSRPGDNNQEGSHNYERSV
jgi:hypothetical protein